MRRARAKPELKRGRSKGGCPHRDVFYLPEEEEDATEVAAVMEPVGIVVLRWARSADFFQPVYAKTARGSLPRRVVARSIDQGTSKSLVPQCHPGRDLLFAEMRARPPP
jgi:hypothetical protein